MPPTIHTAHIVALGLFLLAGAGLYSHEKKQDRLQADCHEYLAALTRNGLRPVAEKGYEGERRSVAGLLHLGKDHQAFCSVPFFDANPFDKFDQGTRQ